jgi:ribonuclease J
VRVCIRRGAAQIGGSCVEIESQGCRIVLDIGLPLDADPDPGLLPPVPGLVTVDASLLAVFVSHAHQDHFGLLRFAGARPRVFMGKDAARMLEAASLFWPGAGGIGETEPLNDGQPVEIGPFKVTPYLVDHSAYDAYALLVEADGQQLFYSGDLRAHGRKGQLFERLLREVPRGVDAMLLEGTTLGRPPGETCQTEAELELEMQSLFESTPGLALVWTSGMNIDRLVTIYKAAHHANRTLILDMYAASVLRATHNAHLPQAEWRGVRVYLPDSQKQAVKRAQAYEFASTFSRSRIYPRDLPAAANLSVLLFRPTMLGDLEKADCLGGAHLVYSLWPGYLEDEKQKPFLERLDQLGIPVAMCHTSGHATPDDLQRLVEALSPREVVPIHSQVPERYAERYANAHMRRDGEWWALREEN